VKEWSEENVENTDGTKQNKRRQKVNVIFLCICEAGLRILRKGEVFP
ncbi:hypothetical protein Tsp_14700, partial [Trichinella spiralis]